MSAADRREGSDADGSRASAEDDGPATASADLEADNAVEQDMIDSVDPGGSPD